jgi:hypothetical protein
MKPRNNANFCQALATLVVGVITTCSPTLSTAAPSCKKVVLRGEVNASQVWESSLGQGWEFRLLPIERGQAGYSGWDLVVDREQPTGYPDALLLGTPPYSSINEREIGTTFGLRAQDAIGWNPRSFHFLIDSSAFHHAQQLFLSLEKEGQLSASATKGPKAMHDVDQLMGLEKARAAGELRIEDARVVPGVSDAAPFAQVWALAGMRTPHQVVAAPDGKSSPRGSLAWMRFSVTLWLPASWKLPPELHGTQTACAP